MFQDDRQDPEILKLQLQPPPQSQCHNKENHTKVFVSQCTQKLRSHYAVVSEVCKSTMPENTPCVPPSRHVVAKKCQPLREPLVGRNLFVVGPSHLPVDKTQYERSAVKELHQNIR